MLVGHQKETMAPGKTMATGLRICRGNDEKRKVKLAQTGVTLLRLFSQKVGGLMIRKIAFV